MRKWDQKMNDIIVKTYSSEIDRAFKIPAKKSIQNMLT